MKIPQKSRYTNGFYTNGTGSTRDQMHHIIYINIDKGNGEPSIYMFSPLPFHHLTLVLSLLFPLTLPSSHPQYPYLFISIFPISPYPLILFPHFPPSQHFPYLHTLPSFPLTHPIIAYNPYTPTLHPLPHVSPHPHILALVPTLYALVSTL